MSQENALREQLKQEFGLHQDPFSNAVSVFYEGGQRQHNLETLRHLAIFGDMVLLLTGEKGAGKTHLLQEFIKRHSDEVTILQLSAQQSSSQPSCIARLVKLAGLHSIANEPINQTISRLIQKYESDFVKSHKRVLWVIDDAEQLPKADLSHFILAFQNLSPESGVALLLSGTPELVDRVSLFNSSDASEWLHQIQLKPFSEEELQDYLSLRLTAAGMSGQLEISSTQMRQLQEMGKGLPGRLNRVFSVIMLGAGEFKSRPDKPANQMGQKVLFAIAGILILSFIFVSYQHGLFEFDEQADQTITDQSETPEEKQSRLAAERSRAAEQVAARLAMLDNAIQESMGAEAIPQSDEVSEQARVTETTKNKEEVVSTEPASAMNKGLPVSDQAEVKRSEEPVSDVEQASVESGAPSVEPPKTVSSTENEAPLMQAAKAKQNATQSAVDRSPTVRRESVAKPVQAEAFRHFAYKSATWVRSKARDFYSLQVLGSHNEDTARRFIERSGLLQDQLHYVETRYKGKPWFVVLYGDYESKAAATAGSASAPKYIRKQQPWMRSFGAIADSLP